MNEPMELTNFNSDIKNKAGIEDKIRRMAYQDPLTGLANRTLFYERIHQAILNAKRKGVALAVLFVDLDGFKRINDTIGHADGDSVLIEVGRRLENSLRKGDTVARTGGDEFLILLQNLQNEDSLKIVSKKILDAFNPPFKIKEYEYSISSSIGCAVFPDDGDDEETLIINADAAMYKAKEKGKNQIVFCGESIKKHMAEELKLTNDLYRALERKELELFYQPQINSLSGTIVGMEALIRWNHPILGTISPREFIPIAEKTGLIIPIGQWVIQTACRQNKAWKDAGLEICPISVNISAHQFEDLNLIGNIKKILLETGLSPEYLKIEITESIAIKEMNKLIETMNRSKQLGVDIAIDDFGTAYSSLNYLKKLPVDVIKIDKCFIDGIGSNSKDEAIIKTVVALGKNLGLRVIAEGVELKPQLDFLTKEECYIIQGFYYNKPMPVSEIETMLRNTVNNKK